MTEKNHAQKPSTITLMATVYLRSRTGRSALNDEKPPTDASLYLPIKETVEKAKAALCEKGFKIESEGVTLSISGPLELFEQVCKVHISGEEVTKQNGSSEKMIIYKSAKTVMKIEGLEDLIEGIVLASRATPF